MSDSGSGVRSPTCGAFASTITSPMSPLAHYPRPSDGRGDEMFGAGSELAPHWDPVARAFDAMGVDELDRRSGEVRRLLERDGVTYDRGGGSESDRHRYRGWPLDSVPMIIPAPDWRSLEAGIVQRTALLDMVLADIYGDRSLLADGSIPAQMLLADPQFLRACDGVRLPTPRQLVVSAVDLVNTADRGWMALTHRTQAPSGAAYSIENRRVISRVFPRVFHTANIQRLAGYVRALRAAMRDVAPVGVEDPSVVVLSPGPRSETAFEHASIAAQLGYPLVQGSDLRVSDGRVWLRTVGDRLPVDVILRRVDATSCDPLELDPDSTLGVPGLVDACRRGVVSVVNPLGAGALENAGLLSLLPELCLKLLGSELLLPSPASWWCGSPAGLTQTISRLGSIMVRPLSRGSLLPTVDTALLSLAETDDLRRRLEAQPAQWVGQERVESKTTPTMSSEGLVPRAAVVRSFVVGTGDYTVMSGGLARIAPDSSGRPISNRGGALSKDVWISGGSAETDRDLWIGEPGGNRVQPADLPSASSAENLFWLGRYAERAEMAVRLLRTVHARRDEFAGLEPGPGSAALRALLETLTRVTGTYPGFVDDRSRLNEPAAELWSLLADSARAGTVAHAINHMLAAIESVRDQMSVDTWVVVGALQDRLARAGGESDPDEAATDALNDILQALLAFAGLSHESMVRDHAWHFTEVGRRLERSIGLVAMIDAALANERTASTESLLLESILTVGESIITYRRRYRSRAAVATALDLMLGDAGNPRSLRFQVDRLARSVGALESGAGLAVGAVSANVDEVSRLVEQLRGSMLATPDELGQRRALVELCRSVLSGLSDTSDALGSAYFIRPLPQHTLLDRWDR